jgi:hypothetical protein
MANDGEVIVGEAVPPAGESRSYLLVVKSEALAAIVSAGKPAPTTLPGTYVVNLLLAGILGLAVLIWFAAYTEQVTALQTLLGLGGLFVWFTFLSNAISIERKAALQSSLDRALSSGTATAVIALLFCVFVGYATHYAAIVVVGRNDSTARLITVRRVLSDRRLAEPLASDALPANGLLRIAVPAGILSRRYRIFATGLPATERDLHVFSRAQVVIPTDFQQRPVALLHLSALDTANAHKITDTTLHLMIWRNDRMIAVTTIPNYDGRSVWLGCDGSVQIPAPIRARWPKEADSLWSDPIAVLPTTLLEAGDAISARLEKTKSGSCIAILPRLLLRPVQYELNVAEVLMPPCS